jgi:pimeloyl-ACP methyl ester carboxylesterase
MGTARNGDVELAFDVEGDGPDLLLIAGTASERALWSLVRPALAQSWRTIAFDNRDSGRSSIAPEACALVQSVADDRTLLASLLWVGTAPATLREADIWEKTDAAMALGPLAPREALVRRWELCLKAETLERLPRLRLPAHVIWCSEDRLLPQPLSQTLVQAIPGAVETRIDACGHVPMVDRPGAFCDAVVGFLAGVGT